MPSEESKLLNTVLNLLANALFKADYKFATDTDWKAVFDECKNQTVAALALNGLNGAIVPQEINDEWFMLASSSIMSNVRNQSEHTYLHNLLTNYGISYCILKGCASAYYYPDPMMRAMGDVDFLVEKSNLDTISELLISEGFTSKLEEHECHTVFRKGRMHLEMHREPAGMPDGAAGEKVKEWLSDIFDTAHKVDNKTVTFVKPDHFHHGLIILLHTYHHLIGEGIGLRHLCDWAVFVNSFSDVDFTEIFRSRLSEIGLWRFAQIMGFVTYKYLSVEYKNWMGTLTDEYCSDLINDIFIGGNFGRKAKNRVQQAEMISNRGKSGVGYSKFIQLIKVKNKEASIYLPIVKNHSFLRPCGWIIMSVRYAFQVISKKRKPIDLSDLIQNADHRKKIYMEFHLFETEK